MASSVRLPTSPRTPVAHDVHAHHDAPQAQSAPAPARQTDWLQAAMALWMKDESPASGVRMGDGHAPTSR